jgi:putative FmdB family regulatory protein
VPIYDYLCSNCRHLTEVIHGINDAGPRFCPACGADGTMRKALVSPAIHFKGSGWAKKDRSTSSSTKSRSGTSSSSDGASSEGGSSGGESGEGAGSRDGSGPREGSGAGSKKPATEAGPTTPSAASES